MRRSRIYIKKTFPEFDIEEGFSENDELHDPNVRETKSHVAERARAVLDRIFNNDLEHGSSLASFSHWDTKGSLLQIFLSVNSHFDHSTQRLHQRSCRRNTPSPLSSPNRRYVEQPIDNLFTFDVFWAQVFYLWS